MVDKPAHIKLVGDTLKDTEFETPSQKAAAKDILENWNETHNFSEIARRSDWSKTHIRNVFEEYFEPAEEEEAADMPESLAVRAADELPDSVLEAYRMGYRDGFSDGRQVSREPSEDGSDGD